MKVINFIQDNQVEIVVTVIILIAVGLLIIKSKKSQIYTAALYLVSVAESEWGSKTGKIKFSKVYSAIKKEFPIIGLFLPEKLINKIIEKSLKELKEILDDHKDKLPEDTEEK